MNNNIINQSTPPSEPVTNTGQLTDDSESEEIRPPCPLTELSPFESTRQLPGETARAYAAFMQFVRLGEGRNLRTATSVCGLSLTRVRTLSAQYHWRKRASNYDREIAILRQHLVVTAEKESAEVWASRQHALREREWNNAQHLQETASRILHDFAGREDLDKIRPSEAAKLYKISSDLARRSAGLKKEEIVVTADPGHDPEDIDAKVARIYGHMAAQQLALEGRTLPPELQTPNPETN